MNIIEDIEKIKSVWKAKADLAESVNHDRACKSYRDIILGIDLALNVVKMQSNTQVKIDKPPVEHDENCGIYHIGGKCDCRAAWWRAT